jgi:hypothetical protein
LAPNGTAVLPGNQGATSHAIGQFAGSVDDRGPSQYIEQFGTFSNALITDMAHHATEAQAAVTPGPAVAAVQSTPIPAVCTAIPAAMDTVTYPVYATLEAPGRGDPLPSGYVDLVLDALHHSFVVPNPLSPVVYVPMVAGANSVMVPVVYGEVGFTLDDQGKVSDIGLTQSSLSAAMNRSLVDAPRRADSMQAFPGQVGVDHPGPIRFFAALSSFQPKSGHYTPIFAVRMPGWRPGSLPGIDPPLDIQPVFPSDAPRPAVGDSVLIQFVVDERGAPVTETLRLLGASHIEYAKAIVDAALHSQYMPAMAAGCPVKGLLERSWRMGSGAP